MKGFCLYWGIGSLLMVPVLKTVLHLPPYMGMILMLGLFWLITDLVHHHKGDHRENSVAKVLTGVDVPTILFFLGILSAVAALQTSGHLAAMSLLQLCRLRVIWRLCRLGSMKHATRILTALA